MEENTNLKDLFDSLGFSEEEQQEVSTWSFSTEGQIDDAIEAVKQLEEDEQRFIDMYTEKFNKLRFELDCKKTKIEKKKEWLIFNIKNTVMASKDKKETATQFRKTYFAGDVIIKKSKTNFLKPELTEEIILKDFADYAKTKTVTTLDWAKLKLDLKIIDGSVTHCSTGKILSDLISTELTSESVIIK